MQHAEQLFVLCCLVVLLSVLLHGSAIVVLVRWRSNNPTSAHAVMPGASVSPPRVTGNLAPLDHKPALPAEPTPAITAVDQAEVPERITLDELRELYAAGEQVVLLDVRTQRTFESDAFIASGAVRMPPDDAVRLATSHRIPWKATLVAYCD